MVPATWTCICSHLSLHSGAEERGSLLGHFHRVCFRYCLDSSSTGVLAHCLRHGLSGTHALWVYFSESAFIFSLSNKWAVIAILFPSSASLLFSVHYRLLPPQLPVSSRRLPLARFFLIRFQPPHPHRWMTAMLDHIQYSEKSSKVAGTELITCWSEFDQGEN